MEQTSKENIDKWRVALKNALNLRTKEDKLKSIEEIYKDIEIAFEVLDNLNLNDKEYAMEAKSLRDLKNSLDFAKSQGMKKAKENN